MALRRFFVRMGWTVEEAANGESGLSLIVLDARQREIAPYALVVSDLRMPGFNGIELYQRLRQSCPEVLGRMIFSTGDIVSEEAAAFVQSTECPVLQKPFELADLRETVARLSPAHAR